VLILARYPPRDARKPSGKSASANLVNAITNTNSYARSAQTGTEIAIVYIPIECALSPCKTAISGHGGARNRADRISDSLPLAQCRNLIASAMTAMETGRAFNRFITVHWESAGIADSEAMAATTAFLKALREWAGDTAYIWTRENGEGKGSHVHMLAHIPAGKHWRGALSRRWLERITGNPYKRGVILTRRIAGAGQSDGALYQTNLLAVLAYILKGADLDAAAALGICHAPGGRIIGKRCGTSRNIGTGKARRDNDTMLQNRGK
jgi:hypothetical protein